MHEDVGLARQALDDFAAARVVEIDADAALVAIVREIDGRLTVPLRGEAARVVTRAGALDFDHVGAEVAEQFRAKGSGDVLCQVDYDEAVQGQWHEVSPRLRLSLRF